MQCTDKAYNDRCEATLYCRQGEDYIIGQLPQTSCIILLLLVLLTTSMMMDVHVDSIMKQENLSAVLHAAKDLRMVNIIIIQQLILYPVTNDPLKTLQ